MSNFSRKRFDRATLLLFVLLGLIPRAGRGQDASIRYQTITQAFRAGQYQQVLTLAAQFHRPELDETYRFGTAAVAAEAAAKLDQRTEICRWSELGNTATRQRYRSRCPVKPPLPPLVGVVLPRTPPGQPFRMGSPIEEPGRDADEELHWVVLSHSFWLKATEVTQVEWQAVLGDNPARFQGKRSCDPSQPGACPVEQVSWFEAVAWCNARSQREQPPLEVCYLNPAGQPYTRTDAVRKLEVLWPRGLTCLGYRLPTEAEWEYAARAGTTTPFSTGACLSTEQANYNGHVPLQYPDDRCKRGSYRAKTVRAGSLPANPWGLHELYGNVWEWCWDWKAAYPPAAEQGHPLVDYLGPSRGEQRVLRGNSYLGNAKNARSALRLKEYPAVRLGNIGFRPARSIP